MAPATNWINVNGSLSTANANKAPKSEDVENITPVRIEPISLIAKRKNKVENAILKAPTVRINGIEIMGMLKHIPRI